MTQRQRTALKVRVAASKVELRPQRASVGIDDGSVPRPDGAARSGPGSALAKLLTAGPCIMQPAALQLAVKLVGSRDSQTRGLGISKHDTGD